MFGSLFMKLVLVFLLFVGLPILMLRYLVHKTIKVVYRPHR